MHPHRLMFLYWGRRGALTRFTLDLGRAALAEPGLSATIAVSRQNERFEDFRELGEALFPVDTFGSNLGALTQSWRVALVRRQLLERLRADRTVAVVNLMSHVWMPLMAPAIRRAGVRYLTIVHDAERHPGDPTGIVQGWMHRDVKHADVVVTLSDAVAERLVANGSVPRARIVTLFHPDLVLGPAAGLPPPAPGEPFRLLFLGRIMPYKGLPLLLDAAELLQARGVPLHIGVYGEGALGREAERLARLGAEVVNRWLTEEEIGAALARFHAVALSYTEASQSGVASVAFGSGVPVIATPVGGLVEQVVDGQTGVLAKEASAAAFADAIARLIGDPGLYAAIRRHIAQSRGDRSMRTFLDRLVAAAVRVKP